ncbi:MAG: 50S ribosomal protein L15 [Candidatus Wallbacteria bacterium]|nr:50S ribosomal protein L15 [Candidatus Wallbacteria bacterium]
MKLHELAPNEGAKKLGKRVGRGPSSGHGGTSCRGNNGQNSRKSGPVRIGFEGGQMPLYRRLPKRGFKNINKKHYSLVNVCDLEKFEPHTIITPEFLVEQGLVKKVEPNGIKILGNGELTKPLKVLANKFTKSAIEKIEKAQGNIEVLK